MNVQTRKQFDKFLTDLREQEIKVFDTETNGLQIFKQHYMVSLSVYFPAVDRSYNLPFYHGYGEVEVKYTDTIHPNTPFEEITWQGKTKKQLYLEYWFKRLKKEKAAGIEAHRKYFENLPEAWLEEIRQAWGKGTYIGHNTRFDAHVLERAGFPRMEHVIDTMVNLHIVFEDWRHIKLDAPYTWSAKEAPNEHLVGQWARGEDGELLKKEQWANRQLKWQAAYQGHKNATWGEETLFSNIRRFHDDLTEFIMENVLDPYNEGLLYVSVKKQKATPEEWDKQRERIKAKLEIDEKAHLWMLPSSKVSEYAELDVRLTWDVYEWTLPIIKQWDNEQLAYDQNNIHHFVAWEMEANGFHLDRGQVQAEIAKLQPRIEELEQLIQEAAADFNFEEFNPNSPKQLIEFLNSGVLAHPYDHIFPDWWPEEKKTGIKTYNIRLSEDDLEEEVDELKGTDKRELERVEDHPVIRLIKEMRVMNKIVHTYLEKWLRAADNDDIVHGSIDDTGTVSGRASSSGDAGNLQNIPDRGSYTVKRAIIPYSHNWMFFAIDYGQLELRLAAWIAEGLFKFDPNMTMTRLFLSGEDMHSYVRDRINIRSILYGNMDARYILAKLGYDPAEKVGKEEEIVAKHTRQIAKTMNFGLLYSGGAKMLSKLLKLEEHVSKRLVSEWRTLFPAFSLAQTYYNELALKRRPRPDGSGQVLYVTQPISGRHRKMQLYPTIQHYKEGEVWKSFNPREAAARKTWNNVVQGLGGFMAMHSAYRIRQELGTQNIKLFANIHDALEGQVRLDTPDLVIKARDIMVDWPMVVPNMTADIQAGRKNWHDIKSVKNEELWIATQGEEGY